MQQNNELKALHLILIGKWYDMIASGEKKEEYREIKPYWQKRLMECYQHGFCRHHSCIECIDIPWLCVDKHFDAVCYHRGYSNTTIIFKLKGISIGKGNPEWGAPEQEVFILELGERLE